MELDIKGSKSQIFGIIKHLSRNKSHAKAHVPHIVTVDGIPLLFQLEDVHTLLKHAINPGTFSIRDGIKADDKVCYIITCLRKEYLYEMADKKCTH